MASTVVPFHRRPLWRVRRTARSLKRTGPALLRAISSLKIFLQRPPQETREASRFVPRKVAPAVERVAFLDRRVHDPTRRALLTALSACERADLPFLRTVTGFPEENLSAHLWKLEKEGLAEIEGGFVRLSDEGRQAIEYWEGGVV